MTALITAITRRTAGLVREVYVCRCGACRWRLECRELPTAVAACRGHVCGEGSA